MRVTIKDVANMAGVSVATVSRALNGKAIVSDATRERINSIAKDLGYEPNVLARGLQMTCGYSIGIVIPDITNAYFGEVFRGVEEVASAEGYTTVFYNTDYKVENERKALKLLTSHRVDGLIMQVSSRITDECASLVSMGYPITLFGQMLEGVDCPKVGCNNFSSAFTMTEYLISEGHRDIAHIGGHTETFTANQRKNGYIAALNTHGIEARNEWIISTDYQLEDAYEQALKLLNQPRLPTAIFAANDDIAAGCYRAIYEKGLRIPEDISLAGHDDTIISTIMRPNLTTMRQKKKEIGRIAARKLLASIRFKQSAQADITIVPTELVKRQSVRKIEK